MYESMYGLAERARFELAEARASTVFKPYANVQDALPALTSASVGRLSATPNSMYVSMYGFAL